jgi:hypothetical protein
MREPLSAERGFSMDFVHPLAEPDTLVIYAVYLPSVDRQIMNARIDTAREIISTESVTRGWSSWLKVREQLEMKELK